MAGNPSYFLHVKRVLYIYNLFCMWNRRSSSYVPYKFSCISFYRRPNDGSHLQPKHADMNKTDKTSVVCDSFNIHICNPLTPTWTCHLKIKQKKSSYITNFLEFFLISVVLWTLQEVQYAYFNLKVTTTHCLIQWHFNSSIKRYTFNSMNKSQAFTPVSTISSCIHVTGTMLSPPNVPWLFCQVFLSTTSNLGQ